MVRNRKSILLLVLMIVLLVLISSRISPKQALRPNAPAVTDERAEAYFARRLWSDAWRAAGGADRRKALDGAAALLAAAFLWDDEARPGGVWRDEVLDLVCEEALWLLERGGEPNPGALGVRRASAGPIAVTFADGGAPGPAAGASGVGRGPDPFDPARLTFPLTDAESFE